MPPDPAEGFRQALFLSSVLAGFAITAIIGLVSMTRRRRFVSFAIICFAIAAGLLLITTVSFTFMVVASSTGLDAHPLSPQALAPLGALGGNMMLLGVVALMIGIGFTGWLHTKTTGVITTIIMVLSLVAIIAIVLYLARLGS